MRWLCPSLVLARQGRRREPPPGVYGSPGDGVPLARTGGGGQVTDLQARIAGVLEDNRHKPARVQAKLVHELVRHLGSQHEQILITPAEDRTEPEPWVEFASRLRTDPLPRLVEQGIATTRNRTNAAMTVLGLDPHEVRAVVIEHDTLRVFRWTDRTCAQTVPIIEEHP